MAIHLDGHPYRRNDPPKRETFAREFWPALKTVLSALGLAAFIALVVWGVIAIDRAEQRRVEECHAKGGTWFHEQGRCLAVPEIPVN